MESNEEVHECRIECTYCFANLATEIDNHHVECFRTLYLFETTFATTSFNINKYKKNIMGWLLITLMKDHWTKCE